MSPLREEWFGDRFVQVHPDLVRALTGDAVGAMVLAAIRYRLRRFGVERDGRVWWRGTQAEIEEITGLSRDQVKRAVERLRGEWLDTEKERVSGFADQTLSYALIYEPTASGDAASSRGGTAPPLGAGATSTSGGGAQSSFLQEGVQEEPPTPLPPPPPSPPVTDERFVKDDDGFEEFWRAFPRKERQVVTRAAYRHALESTDPDTLLAGAKGYARKITRDGTEPRYIQTADRWLREERWTDDYAAPRADRPWYHVAE